MDSCDVQAMLAHAYNDCVTGRIAAAQNVVVSVRESFDISHQPADAVEIFLIEGIIQIYLGNIRDGVDRLHRSCAIALAIDAHESVALARAWLSMVRFNEGKVLEAAGLVSESLRSNALATERLRLRIGTMAAVLCRYCGQKLSSDRWFLVARLAATRMNVSGVLSSLIFDLAVSEIDLCQLERLEGRLDPVVAETVHRQVCSALRYDAGAEAGAQNVLHDLALGMSLNLCGRFREAKDHLMAFLDAPQVSRDADLACGVAELAMAELGLGAGPLGPDLESRLISCEGLVVEPLERAILFAAIAECFRRRGFLIDAESAEAKKVAELTLRRNICSALGSKLDELQLISPPGFWVQ